MNKGRTQQSTKRSRKEDNNITGDSMLSNNSSLLMDFSPYILESSHPLGTISNSHELDSVSRSVNRIQGNIAPSSSLNKTLNNQPKRRKTNKSLEKGLSSYDQVPPILESFSMLTTERNKGEYLSSSGQSASSLNPQQVINFIKCTGNPYIDRVTIYQVDDRGYQILPGYHNIGDPNWECNYCGAIFWKNTITIHEGASQ
ncbi:hypothetical protein OROMI_008502 [Orobanche minor]